MSFFHSPRTTKGHKTSIFDLTLNRDVNSSSKWRLVNKRRFSNLCRGRVSLTGLLVSNIETIDNYKKTEVVILGTENDHCKTTEER